MRRCVLALFAFAASSVACRAQREDAQAQATQPSSVAAPAPPAPDAHALVVNNCLSCHSEEMLAQQRLTDVQWAKVVKKMAGWGALITSTDEPIVSAYLAEKYGPNAGPYVPAMTSAADASAQLATVDDGAFANGDAERGRGLFLSLCAACHGPEARGALGTNLADRPVLWRAQEFAKTVRTGRGKMPPQANDDGQIADILAHLRRLQ